MFTLVLILVFKVSVLCIKPLLHFRKFLQNTNYFTRKRTLGPIHTTPFLYKNGEKNLRFCGSVHTDPNKNATKTEAFENAVKSGYPQKRRFLKTLQYPTMSFTKTEQCERTKTDVFRCVFVIRQSSVNR